MVTIHIYKSKRMLYTSQNGNVIKQCPIGLGHSPLGHKHNEGDGKTPEGKYYICTKNERSKYTLFLGLSYPSPPDAKHAYNLGAITKNQLIEIETAHLNKARPPWDTPLGGAVGIHGGAVQVGSVLADNSAGCITILDCDIHEIWKLVDYGTTVNIYP